MSRIVRNFGISAHVDAGKTTLAERILFATGRIHAMGDVRTDRPPTLDHDPQEQARGITIRAAATTVRWGGATLNLVDTPGHLDFTVEVERALQAMDGAVLVLCAVGGVQAQTRTVERQMARYGVPRLAFVNKCDRDGADPERVVAELRDRLGVVPVPVQVPVDPGPAFRSVLDLVEPALVTFEGVHGTVVVRSEVPAGLAEAVRAGRERLLDALSLVDDALAARLLERGDVDAAELRACLRAATLRREVVPVLFGAAYRDLGVQPLLDAIVAWLPSPDDRPRSGLAPDPDAPAVALAFKLDETEHGQLTWLRVVRGTLRPGDRLVDGASGETHRVRRLVRLHGGRTEPVDAAVAGDLVAAIGPSCASGTTLCDPASPVVLERAVVPEPVVECALVHRSGSADRFAALLRRYLRQDPSLRARTDEESGELLLRGMGELHLDVVKRRFEEEHVGVSLGAPRVTGRLALGRAVDFDHTLSKQTGGPGMYAKLVGRVEPAEGFDLRWEVKGGAVPSEYRPAIEAGFRQALLHEADVPVVGATVVITDGKVHSNDSSDQAFHLCARDAFREVLARGAPVRLEPVVRAEVTAPAEHQGAVLGSLLSRGGRVVDAGVTGALGKVVADVPLARMFGYPTTLRSLTSGAGEVATEPVGYAPIG